MCIRCYSGPYRDAGNHTIPDGFSIAYSNGFPYADAQFHAHATANGNARSYPGTARWERVGEVDSPADRGPDPDSLY